MIHFEIVESVAQLRMDHGKANAFDTELLVDLDSALERVERDDGIRAVVLTGTGSIFSAGVDLFRILDGGEAYVRQFLASFSKTMKRFFGLPKPLVGALNGHAIAGGCVLAATCDLRIMSGGKIGITELLVGVPFPAAPLGIIRFAFPSWQLQRMIYMGITPGFEEAHQLGLVDHVCAPDELQEKALETARALASIPCATFEMTKRQLREPVLLQIEERSRASDAQVQRLWLSDEVRGMLQDYLQRVLGRP